MTSTIENPFAAAWNALREHESTQLGRRVRVWQQYISECGPFQGSDSVGRPDDDFEKCFRTLVATEVNGFRTGESREELMARTSAMIGLVAQLDVALRAGSTITVEAVINVARAAFRSGYPFDFAQLSRIGTAGMCVMWILNREWFLINYRDFDAAVSRCVDKYHVYRPDSFLYGSSFAV